MNPATRRLAKELDIDMVEQVVKPAGEKRPSLLKSTGYETESDDDIEQLSPKVARKKVAKKSNNFGIEASEIPFAAKVPQIIKPPMKYRTMKIPVIIQDEELYVNTVIAPNGLPFFHRADCGEALTGNRVNFMSGMKRNLQDLRLDATKTLQDAYSEGGPRVPTVISVQGLEQLIENCTIAKAAARKDELLKRLRECTANFQQKPTELPLASKENEPPNGSEWYRNFMAPKVDDSMQVAIKQEVEVKRAKFELESFQEEEGLRMDFVRAGYKTKMELQAADHRTKMEMQAAELEKVQTNKEVYIQGVKDIEFTRVQIEKDKLKQIADLEVNIKQNEMIIQEEKLTEMAKIEIEAKKNKIVRVMRNPHQ